MQQKNLIVVVGPTAIGKTALAITLAQHFQTEVISADSRQFFREMAIGTAKPTVEELAQVPHHFINSHSVDTLFSTGDFEVEALKLMEKLFETKNNLILVGGSGLYINAICNGLDELPEIDLTIREQLNSKFATDGLAGIKKQLQALDPEYYERVDQSNTQRVIRGLEVILSTGKKLSDFQTNTKKKRPFNIVKIGLNTDRESLYSRINKRVNAMVTDGLLEEVKALLPYRSYNALNTVGYSEIFDYLDGKNGWDAAVTAIQQNTRRFAKRQITWFKRDQEIKWFNPNQSKEIIEYLDDIIG